MHSNSLQSLDLPWYNLLTYKAGVAITNMIKQFALTSVSYMRVPMTICRSSNREDSNEYHYDVLNAMMVGTRLTRLFLQYFPQDKRGINVLANALSQSNLSYFVLHSKFIDDDDLLTLTKSFLKNRSLAEVILLDDGNDEKTDYDKKTIRTVAQRIKNGGRIHFFESNKISRQIRDSKKPDPIEPILQSNQKIRAHWMAVCVTMAFFRSTPREYAGSIFPLFPAIFSLLNVEPMGAKEYFSHYMWRFSGSKFFTNALLKAKKDEKEVGKTPRKRPRQK